MITILDIRVRFAAKRYTGSEATGFVLVTLELLGGVSTKPFSVSVTPSELSPASAKGMVIPYNYCKISKVEKFCSFELICNSLENIHGCMVVL